MQVRIQAEATGACSGRSKSENLAYSHVVALRPAQSNKLIENLPILKRGRNYFITMPAALYDSGTPHIADRRSALLARARPILTASDRLAALDAQPVAVSIVFWA